MLLKFTPSIPYSVYAKTVLYTPGTGHESTWSIVESDGKTVFYCEWQGSHGDRAIAAQAAGVTTSARVRAFYNPHVFEALSSRAAVIVKNAGADALKDGAPDKDNPNVYELWGGVDDVLCERLYIEFQVRRYTGK
jgi:hypothetical protein